MRLSTRFTQEFGIDAPIMAGGLHQVSYAELCANVSNAGALGFITAVTHATPELLRAEIRKVRTLTDKPFGVNLSFLPAASPPDYAAYITTIIEEGVKIVETAGNNPGVHIARMAAAGIKVIHKVVTIRHAKTAVKAGAHWLSVDGLECAGHPGMDDIGGLLLLAMFKREFGDSVPFIASGGIATGAQLAACLALGAEGVNMGTRFLTVKDNPFVHDNIKAAILNAKATDTTTILRTLKNTERVFLNEEALKAKAAEEYVLYYVLEQVGSGRNLKLTVHTSTRFTKRHRAKPGDIGVIREFIAGNKYKQVSVVYHVIGYCTLPTMSGQIGLSDKNADKKSLIW